MININSTDGRFIGHRSTFPIRTPVLSLIEGLFREVSLKAISGDSADGFDQNYID